MTVMSAAAGTAVCGRSMREHMQRDECRVCVCVCVCVYELFDRSVGA